MFAGKIRVISLLDGSQHDVDVRGWNSLNHINWAADGKGWYVSSELALTSTLLYVDLSGNPAILLREPGFFTEIWGIPSPDGKHLAFVRYNFGNNAYMLDGLRFRAMRFASGPANARFNRTNRTNEVLLIPRNPRS